MVLHEENQPLHPAAPRDRMARLREIGEQASRARQAAAYDVQPVPVPPTVPVPTDAARRDYMIGGLGFTARAVVMLAADPALHDLDIAYVATWAPKIENDMAARGGRLAYLSRDTLSETCGVIGQDAMRPGNIVDRAAATIGLVRMVARGTPGAVPVDEETYRGHATSWTLDGELADFTHVPAAPAQLRHAYAVTRDYLPDTDLKHLSAWLNPLHTQWGTEAMGRGGWRLCAALIARFGLADVVIGAADAARLCGTVRSAGFTRLARLQAHGLAVREGTRWRVQLAHLHMTLDHREANQVRPLTPGQQRARLHNRTWFTRSGRALRAMARSAMELLRGPACPPGANRWAAWAAQPRGGLIAILEAMHTQQVRMEANAERAVGAFRGRAALGGATGVPEPPAAPQAPPPTDSQPPVPARNAPYVSPWDALRAELAMRRRIQH